MDDFEKNVKKCKIGESSGQTENMTASDTESISPITTPTANINTSFVNAEEIGIEMNMKTTSTPTGSTDVEQYKTNCPTASPKTRDTIPTTTLTTIPKDGRNNGITEEWDFKTNVYTTSIPTSNLTSSLSNKKENNYGENSPTETISTNENKMKCQTVCMMTNPT